MAKKCVCYSHGFVMAEFKFIPKEQTDAFSSFDTASQEMSFQMPCFAPRSSRQFSVSFPSGFPSAQFSKFQTELSSQVQIPSSLISVPPMNAVSGVYPAQVRLLIVLICIFCASLPFLVCWQNSFKSIGGSSIETSDYFVLK